jgi:nucleoside-diphosphate-sugar epimerase
MALMKSDLYEPVNIGNDREITMWELLEIMKKVVGEKFPEYHQEGGYDIVNGTSDRDDPKVRRPDLTLARERLGYQIEVGLERGLEETIRYFHSMQSQKN